MGKRAFLVGSNGPSWAGPLKYAEADVAAVATCLRDACEFDVEAVSGSIDPFLLVQQLTAFVERTERDDLALLYFSGHGQLGPKGRLHLLLPDTSTTLLRSIRFDVALDLLEVSPARRKLVILDCCHAGAAGGIKSPHITGQEIADPHPSLVMLLASSRLEKAREIDELKGSFLSKHMCAILSGDERSSISILDLSVQLRRAAEEHNGSSKQSVPFPYLFGDVREPILLKSPRTPGPIHIHLQNLHSLESEILFAELAPYDPWNAINLLNELPVYLHWSELVAKRLEVIQQYLNTDTWPCEVEDRTKEQFRSLLNHVAEAKSSIEHGVRVACAAAADVNGANLRSQRNAAMQTFIEAKALALVRLLLAMRLHGEPPDAWMPPLYWLDTSYSTNVYAGLTPLVQSNYAWTFWMDVDLELGNRYRVYVPQRLGEGRNELFSMPKDVILRCLVPQILDARSASGLVEDVRSALRWEPEQFWERITVRGERYISTSNHNGPDSFGAERERAIHHTLDVMRRTVAALPSAERKAALKNILLRYQYPTGIGDEIPKLIEEFRA